MVEPVASPGRKLERAVRLVEQICHAAGNPKLIDQARRHLRRCGVTSAIRRHDSAVLFEWLAEMFSYQGIADSVAYGYIQQHGRVRWDEIAAALAAGPSCPKLKSYWHFEGCGYRKGTHSCADLTHLPQCPLPTHDLRNGRLNQTAYSLFLFVRDIAHGDLVAWLDQRLAALDTADADRRTAGLDAALLEPLGHISGVSNKVASMTLASLLLAGDPRRKSWVEAGAAMIAVDTLVHNFLHRTGILRHLGVTHPYGAGCYARDGCAPIILRIAHQIDASRFNSAFPTTFPRFVQYAIWRFCAEEGLAECNGRQIDDRRRCDRDECPVFRLCRRVPLKPERSKDDA